MQFPSIALVLALPISVVVAAPVAAQSPSLGERSVFLSPFLPASTPTIRLPRGARELEFLPELVDMIPIGGVFDIVQFPMPDGTLRDIWMTEFNVVDDDATIAVMQAGAEGTAAANYGLMPQVRTFRGRVTGVDNSLVYLAFSPDAISGMIRVDGTMYSISNGPRGDMPVVISDISNLPEGAINWAEYTCQVRGDLHGEGVAPGEGGIAALGTCKKIELAFETDNEFRGLFSTNQAAIDYATQIAGGMNVIYYEEENLYPVVSFLRIWSPGVTDPWTAGSSGAQLDQFVGAWAGGQGPAGSNPRDLAHLVSARDLGGGVAYLNAVCNPNIGFAVSGNISGFFPFPLESNSAQNWDIMVATHEMGHNCGCNHTHDLGVDNCVGGACISNGTIMSYCHLCPGGLANIVLNFASANKAQMDAHLGGVACLSTPCPIYDPSAFRASDGSFIDAVVLTWNGPAIAAARFEIERRVVGTVPYSSLNANVDPSLLFYNDTSAATGVSYDYRIRSIRVDNGTPSDWIGPDSGFRGAVGPTNLSASDGEFSDRVALVWEAPIGYTPIKYRVYRTTLGGGALQIDETTNTTYLDSGTYTTPDPAYPDTDGDGTPGPVEPTNPGAVYQYEVRALATATILSAPSTDTGFRSIPGPSNLSASGSINGTIAPMTDRVRLTWSVPGGMNRIYVYRSSSGGAYVQVASLSGGFSAWSDLNVASNVSYNYKVRGFSNLQGMTAPSEPDLGFKLEAPRVTSASDGAGANVVVVWSAPATWTPSAYSIWRKPSGRDPWPASPLAANVAAGGLNTYVDTTATPGVVYVYAVTAKSAQFNTYSTRGSTNTGYATVLPPINVAASDGTFPGFVELTWTPVGASSGVFFDVYRRRANTNETYVLLTSALQASTLDQTAVSGVVYQYYVRTRTTNGATSLPSATDTGFR